jgi:Autophagy receptor ATG43
MVEMSSLIIKEEVEISISNVAVLGPPLFKEEDEKRMKSEPSTHCQALNITTSARPHKSLSPHTRIAATMSDIPLPAQTLLQDTHMRQHPTLSDVHPSTSADSIHLLDDEDEVASISSSVLDGPKKTLPPLPDLRFEQSYLASIAPAEGVWWKILLITLKDQMVFPLVQGLLYNVAVAGWRSWNRNARFGGRSLGGT